MGKFRFFLASLVVFNHTQLVLFLHTQGVPHTRIDSGLVAVCTFFFISGYLMPLAFNSNYSRGTFLSRSLSYLANRFLRIYPLYWLSLLLVLLYDISTKSCALTMELVEHPKIVVQNFALLGLNQ